MSKSNIHLSGFLFLSALLLVKTLPAQQIDAKITFHTDKISQEEKEFIADLDTKLEKAIESHRWEGAKRRHILPITYDIFWDKATRSNPVHNYSAGILISVESGLALRDKRAEFRYAVEDWIHLGEPYEPLSGLIEFYTWICLGFDADRFSPLGGNLFYEQARMAGERARAEAQYSLGWDDRRAMAIELTDSLYASIRRARFHMTAGVYYAEVGNQTQASANLAKAVKLLTDSKWKKATLKIDDHVFKFIDGYSLSKSLLDLDMNDQQELLDEWIKQAEAESK